MKTVLGNTENFQEPFKDSQTDYKKIALSFYSGIFSYAGWNYVRIATESYPLLSMSSK